MNYRRCKQGVVQSRQKRPITGAFDGFSCCKVQQRGNLPQVTGNTPAYKYNVLLYLYAYTYCFIATLLYIYNVKSRKLYNRIALLRAERGLSRKELAEAIGVNFQTVGYLEREEYNPSLDLAFRIGEYFGFPIDFIFSTAPMKPLSQEAFTKKAE